MKRDVDCGVVFPSLLPQDEHKGYFYFERILSIIPVGKWAGEIPSMGVDTLLRRFAAMISAHGFGFLHAENSLPLGFSHLRGQPSWLLYGLHFSRAPGWHPFICLLPCMSPHIAQWYSSVSLPFMQKIWAPGVYTKENVHQWWHIEWDSFQPLRHSETKREKDTRRNYHNTKWQVLGRGLEPACWLARGCWWFFPGCGAFVTGGGTSQKSANEKMWRMVFNAWTLCVRDLRRASVHLASDPGITLLFPEKWLIFALTGTGTGALFHLSCCWVWAPRCSSR